MLNLSVVKSLSRDVIAGLSVALVLIPQSLAYAELAGVPAPYGLYAAALPPLAAAFFASSPYLQTGPTALTSLLTFGVLAAQYPPDSPTFVAAAALLALIVGLVRLLLGALRLGGIAYFMSQPVLMGFTSAAALLILFSQIPAALGLEHSGGVIEGLLWVLMRVERWQGAALELSLLTLLVILGGRRISPIFPGVLVAVVLGVFLSLVLPYEGPQVGAVVLRLPGSLLALPWADLPALLLGGTVVALVGFAEATAVARTYMMEERSEWDPHREFISQGLANLAAGLVGAFPVGGSFSRSSLAKLSGARSRLSGAVAGLTVLAFLPFAGILEVLPKAVLAGIIIAPVLNLVRISGLVQLWRYSKAQATVAWSTFFLTLLLSPRLDHAVIIGIGLAIAVHLGRELQFEIGNYYEDDVLHIRLGGVLWFGSAPQLESRFRSILLEPQPTRHVVFDLSSLGHIDLSGMMTLSRLRDDARRRDITVEMQGLSDKNRRIMERL